MGVDIVTKQHLKQAFLHK